MKPKVYIETSVISYLTAMPSNDLRAMANQNTTAEWWEARKGEYNIVASDVVISEASLGNPDAAERRLAIISDIPLLQVSNEARLLASSLINEHALPKKAETDAYHVALAAVNGIDYLLTWNCTHIANAHT